MARPRSLGWSARFGAYARLTAGGTEALDIGFETGDRALRALAGRAGSVQFRWRYAGANRARTFALPAGLDGAVAFRLELLRAMLEDWPADSQGRPLRPGSAPPVPPAPPAPRAQPAQPAQPAPGPEGTGVPVTGPATTGPGGALAPVIGLAGRRPSPGTGGGAGTAPAPVRQLRPQPGGSGQLPRAQAGSWAGLDKAVSPLADFAELVAWRMADLSANPSGRTGDKRRGNTLGGYEDALGFASRWFVYGPDDARLDQAGASPGQALRLGGPGGIEEEDCLAYVEARQRTNLRTRHANETAVAAWAARLEAAERDAGRLGRALVVPAPPALLAEVATRRTVRAHTDVVRAALGEAHAEGRVQANPWTARVDKAVARSPRTHFELARLPDRDQVAAMAALVAGTKRRMYVAGQGLVLVDGERYRLLIEGTTDCFLRSEEVEGLRCDDVVVQGPEPGLRLCRAEVTYPLRYSAGTGSRVEVTLKHRDDGVVRVVPFRGGRAEAERWAGHMARFCRPDPSSADPERRNPRVFTTHTGAPLDTAAFWDLWVRPVMADALGEAAPAFEGFQFRLLRHTGISLMLYAGAHYEEVARLAGNSPEVVRRHYKGVIEAAERATRSATRSTRGGPGEPGAVAVLASQLVALDDAEAEQRLLTELQGLPSAQVLALLTATARTARNVMERNLS